MFKPIIPLVLFILSFIPLSALPVDREQALHIASRWWGSGAEKTAVKDVSEIDVRSFTAAYYCRRADEFLLVATDDRLPLVLGYGKAGASSAMPAALRAMLRRPASSAVYPPPGAEWQAVPPLLTTVRHQSAPYNACCPVYRFDNGQLHTEPCVVGCVATAMEQILTYYRRTYEVKACIKGWETPHYTVQDIPAGLRVDSRLIRDNYDTEQTTAEEKDAVARLSYYLGQACHMDWGVAASGAQSSKMAEGVKRYFGLGYVHYLDSYLYAPTAYWNFIAAEIAARRPVYYAGSIMRTGGHAFVLDGIDDKGLFHVNWGYGGDYDGYFRLDVLAHPQPEGDRYDEFVESGFFCNQQAIAVHPDEITDAFVPRPLDRKGDDVTVESVIFGRPPLSGCYTPVYLCLHNTTSQALTTAFALLENEPSDTNRVEQAHWLSMTGRTLEAGERDTVCVHTRFSRSGKLLLSVTPDGDTLVYSTPIEVGNGGTDQVEAGPPESVSFTPTTATFRQHYSNPSATERAAQYFVYDLQDRETGKDGQIERFIYLDAASDTSDVVCFKGLHPGHRYTLRLRRLWPIVQTLDFTLPLESSIQNPQTDTTGQVVRWFTIDGRSVASPTAPGVYLKKTGNQVQKILITTSR